MNESIANNQTIQEQYRGHLEAARDQKPLIIKRLSNKISDEDVARLISPTTAEFNPDFDYPGLFDLSPEEIEAKRATAIEHLRLAQDIAAESGYKASFDDEFTRQLAASGVDNLNLIEAAQLLVKAPNAENADRLKKINEIVVGKVDAELSQGVVNYLHNLIAVIPPESLIASRVGAELRSMLPVASGEQSIVSLPEDVFENFRRAYLTIFSKWIDDIMPPGMDIFDVNAIAAVYDTALKSMGFDKIGWSVVIDKDATSLKISMEEKLITIPSAREPLSREEFSAKIVHEIGYITRGWNGSHISRSAEHGMPDYLDAEEGLMAYGEQFMMGAQSPNVTYAERYLGAGSLEGVLDGVEKDFKDVFAIMWRARIIMSKQNSPQDYSESDIQKAKKESLVNAQRLFRGSDGKIPGAGWTKDKAYYQGQAKLTQFLIEFDKKMGVEHIYMLFAAKFDPTNPQHNQSLGMPFK